MGGGPSREDILKDQEFLWRIQEQQQKILKENTNMIQEFFRTVDDLVKDQGSLSDGVVKEQETPSDAAKKKVEDITHPLTNKPNPDTKPPGPDPGKEGEVVYEPNPSVIVLLNQASVIYKQEIGSKPGTLSTLVDTVQGTINDILNFQSGKEYKPGNGAQVPGPLIDTVKTLFAKEEAIVSVANGILSVAQLLLSSMESNVSVSSSLLKKIQFVAPGLYCATYYATSEFHWEYKGYTKTEKISYSLSAGGMYLVTSPKLIQIVYSLQMYQEIASSFSKRLKASEETVDQLIAAQMDTAYFGHKFGFTEQDYQALMTNLKTEVMKSIVTDFWTTCKEYENKVRTDIWNQYVKESDIPNRVQAVKNAYTSAYDDLKKYYLDFVLNPPIRR